jgi:hypothetical protein
VGNAEEIARWTGGGIICPAARDERGYTQVDPEVLAREMRRCMDDPRLLARLGETGKTTWLRQFTWQAIAPRYEAILTGHLCCSVLPHHEFRSHLDHPAGLDQTSSDSSESWRKVRQDQP